DERLDLRCGIDSILLPIPAISATDDIGGIDGPNLPEQFGLLVLERRRVGTSRWFHAEHRDDLQQMVLDDITDGTNRFVEAASARDPEVLGHRDLHTRDEVTVPDRFEHRVREPKHEQAL